MMTRVDIPVVVLVAVYVAFVYVLVRKNGRQAEARKQRLQDAFAVLSEELIRG